MKDQIKDESKALNLHKELFMMLTISWRAVTPPPASPLFFVEKQFKKIKSCVNVQDIHH